MEQQTVNKAEWVRRIELTMLWGCLVHFQTHAIMDLVVTERDVVLVDRVP